MKSKTRNPIHVAARAANNSRTRIIPPKTKKVKGTKKQNRRREIEHFT